MMPDSKPPVADTVNVSAPLLPIRLRIRLNAWTEAGGEPVDDSRAGGQASGQAVRREQIAAVQQAVAALPVELRTALVLFEYEQQSMADIAAVLDCTPKAVENRLYRARQRLKQVLAPLLT